MGKYYIDGPIFLKSGVDLLGSWSEDDYPYETQLILHGDEQVTGTDGIINAHGVTDVEVRRRRSRGTMRTRAPWERVEMARMRRWRRFRCCPRGTVPRIVGDLPNRLGRSRGQHRRSRG